MHQPVVLVTGTSTGIGRIAVQELSKAGCMVIATARKISDIEDLRSDSVHIDTLDVTNEKSMVGAISRAVKKFGRLDVLVNNAGYGVMLPAEELPIDAVRQQFEVNVFGPTRLAQLALPHMRKQGGGRIINVSSVAGWTPVPSMGAYCGTKFALRGMTESMWMEVRPFGIHCALIEPGVIKTNFGTRSREERTKLSHNPSAGPYAALHQSWEKHRMLESGANPIVIANMIVHAATSKRPKFHYIGPLDAKAGVFSRRFLPEAVTRKVLERYFHINKLSREVQKE